MAGAREEEILDAIENGTYKFAINQCQKLIKKSPNVTFYQVLYNYALLESGKVEEATKNSLELMNKTPNDTRSLELLNTIFNKVGKPTEALQVYENAAKKYASFEILTSWFHLGCETANVRVLQKSAIALKNFNSKHRLFNLWAAFTTYLAAVAHDATVMEKTLFPKLGLKIIEGLKPLKNEQEVYVLVKLQQLNGQLQELTKEILEFTGDHKLDLELQIILLETQDKLEDWEKLYKFSELVLIDYKLDDFDTWKFLIKSGLKLNKDGEVLKRINDYQSRNSRLALVEYHYQSNTDIHDAVFEYLKVLGVKTCAFLDIKQYASKLDGEKVLDWLSEQLIPEQEKGLIWTLNASRFKAYFRRDSIFKSPEFIIENIQNFENYKSLLSNKNKYDLFPGDEFILLAIQALLTQEFSIKSIVTVIIILENIVLKDEHEFHLRLWLIQLYTLINCHNQAKVHYDSLKIKNVQHDIFDHYLVSRLSSIYPKNDILKQGFEIYNSGEHIYYLKIGFNKGAFNKLGSMIEFIQRLDNSALKKHEILQGNKIGRLLNDKSIAAHYNQFSSREMVFDNRDFAIFWNFGIFEELDFKREILANIPPLNSSYDKIQTHLEELMNGVSGFKEQGMNLSDLTPAERWSFDLITTVSQLLSGTLSKLSTVQDLFQATPMIPGELSWKVTHNIITIIDTCKSINIILSKDHIKASADKEHTSIIRSHINKLLEQIREDTILEKKSEVSKHIDTLRKDLANDKTLELFEIDAEHKDRILDIIAYSNNEVFKILRLL